MKVCLFLNHACNLRCSYCYNGRKFHRRMPEEVAHRGVEMALTDRLAQTAQVSFFGGEPLLELELIRSLTDHADRRARELGTAVRYSLVTNGTLLSGEALDFVLDHDFYLGVSLDGCREAHDTTRRFADGRPSFDRVMDNLQRLVARKPPRGLRVIGVIDPTNVDLLGDSFDTYLDAGVRNISMNINYEAVWDEEARGRLSAALRRLGDRYVAAYRRGERFGLNLFDAKVATHLKGGYTCADLCDFGCREIAVAPSGRLYPCDRLVGQDDRDDVVIGDVFDGVDVVRRDALIADKNRILAECAGCALIPRCMHWCGCVNHALTGSVGGVSGLLCWSEQLRIEEADRCASLLYDEGNPRFLQRFYAQQLPG